MKFIKDILLFEINTTGKDLDKDNIIQLSAVLLDKDNLLERAHFDSLVRVSYLDSLMSEHARLLGTSYDEVRRSPKITDVCRHFHSLFGNDLLLATHTVTNVIFLRSAFKKAAVTFDYDSHILELWTLGYIYTLNYGLKKMPTFHTFLDLFRLSLKNPSDSMERVRLQSEIFRKIVKEA